MAYVNICCGDNRNRTYASGVTVNTNNAVNLLSNKHLSNVILTTELYPHRFQRRLSKLKK